MITRVQVKNFRNLAEVDVQLGPLTVLVGRNGAGKSTFLDVLRFIRDALRLGLDTAISQRGGIGAIRRWSPQGRPFDIGIKIEMEQKDASASYHIVLGSSATSDFKVKHEICVCTDATGRYEYEKRNGKFVKLLDDWHIKRRPSDNPGDTSALVLNPMSVLFEEFETARVLVTQTSFYSFHPNALRPPQAMTRDEALLEDGSNLATTLRTIKRGDHGPDLLSALGRVVEGVTDFRVTEAGGYLVTELKHETNSMRSPWFPLAQESDGTLRVLGLLASLYQETPRLLTAVEEPELSIHPGALGVLCEVIEEAATRTQILIATQSPDLISHFGADQLRVVENVQGHTRIGPIDEVQREAINDQLFSAGNLLKIEGLHVSSREETVAAHA